MPPMPPMPPYTGNDVISDPVSSSSFTKDYTDDEVVTPSLILTTSSVAGRQTVLSRVISPLFQDTNINEYPIPISYSSARVQKPISEEKAAVKRAMAQESNFRQEKQDILQAMGASPAELLTPSADWRLQRKLNFPAIRRSSHQQDYNRDTGVGFYDPDIVTFDDSPQQLDNSLERDQYVEEEIRDDQGRKLRFKLFVAISISLLCGGIIAMIVVLTTSGSSSKSTSTTPDASSTSCQVNSKDMVLCTTGFVQVPDCAQEMYDALIVKFIDSTPSVAQRNTYGCEASQFGLVALAVAMTNYEQIDDPELYWALATIYFALGGFDWRSNLHWLTGSSPCSGEWYGVECDNDNLDDNGEILIDLEGNLLRGTLPTQIGRISALKSLKLGHNLIEGTLPSEIGFLTNLEILSLDEVSLTSQIPTEIGSCTKLREISFLQTLFTGFIPTQIGYLTKLGTYSSEASEVHHFEKCFLPTCPSQICSTFLLESLTLQGTKLEGSIPSELVKLSRLQHLLLRDMFRTSGTMPSGLTGLSKLLRLEVSNALFDESTVSKLVSNLPKSLEILVLSLINLKGTMPTEIGTFKNLSYVEFSENSMTGTIPTELGLLTDLDSLLLDGNSFQATIPTAISQLTKLEILTLGQSDLTGTVPSELGALTSLETLDLSGNNFSGVIPLTLCHVQNLYFTPCRKDQTLTVAADCLVAAGCENKRRTFI